MKLIDVQITPYLVDSNLVFISVKSNTENQEEFMKLVDDIDNVHFCCNFCFDNPDTGKSECVATKFISTKCYHETRKKDDDVE